MIWIFNIPHPEYKYIFCVRFKNNSSLVLVHLFWINSLNQEGNLLFHTSVIIKKFHRRRKEGGKEKSEKL